MSGIIASIVYGPFSSAVPVTGVQVTLTDSTGGNAPMTQTAQPTDTSVTFATVAAGTWTATYQAVGADGTIGPAFTTAPLVITAPTSVNIPVGGSLSLTPGA